MTAAQFAAVLPHLGRLNPKRVEAARMALVDDLAMDGIAKVFGWGSRQTVSDAVSSVFAAWARFEEVQLVAHKAGIMTPPGWESVTLVAPPALITRWKKEVANEFGKVLAATHKTQVQAVKPRKRSSTIKFAAQALGAQLEKQTTTK
jgi:hypothetical protein